MWSFFIRLWLRDWTYESFMSGFKFSLTLPVHPTFPRKGTKPLGHPISTTFMTVAHLANVQHNLATLSWTKYLSDLSKLVQNWQHQTDKQTDKKNSAKLTYLSLLTYKTTYLGTSLKDEVVITSREGACCEKRIWDSRGFPAFLGQFKWHRDDVCLRSSFWIRRWRRCNFPGGHEKGKFALCLTAIQFASANIVVELHFHTFKIFKMCETTFLSLNWELFSHYIKLFVNNIVLRGVY